MPLLDLLEKYLPKKKRFLARKMIQSDKWRTNYDEWRSCTSKRQKFSDEESAKAHAERIGMSAYKCRYCDYWHLTSNGKATKYRKKSLSLGPIKLSVSIDEKYHEWKRSR